MRHASTQSPGLLLHDTRIVDRIAHIYIGLIAQCADCGVQVDHVGGWGGGLGGLGSLLRLVRSEAGGERGLARASHADDDDGCRARYGRQERCRAALRLRLGAALGRHARS